MGEGIFGLFFVADVEPGEAGAGRGEGAEVGGEGDARQLALEIGLVAFAVAGVVQEAVDVMEDVPLADRVVLVMRAEPRQRPVGDVFAAVAAVLVVGVEGEALGAALLVVASASLLTSQLTVHSNQAFPLRAFVSHTNHAILRFSVFGVGKIDGKTYTHIVHRRGQKTDSIW